MTLQMSRAFHPSMQVKLKVHSIGSGYYNDDNDYIEGKESTRMIRGVVLRGNRFSQFEESISVDTTEGGERFPNFRTLYVNYNRYGYLLMNDLIEFRCVKYHIMQKGDESHFGFTQYIIEEHADGGVI